MKKVIFLGLFTILLMCTGRQVSAQATQDFKLSNYTGVTIDELHISPSQSETWGSDVLGVDVLQNNEFAPIVFSPANEICLYDIKITDSKGANISFYDIDLCKWLEIELYYDAEKGVGTAQFK